MAEFKFEVFLKGEEHAANVERLRKVQIVQVAKHLGAEAQVEGLQIAQMCKQW